MTITNPSPAKLLELLSRLEEMEKELPFHGVPMTGTEATKRIEMYHAAIRDAHPLLLKVCKAAVEMRKALDDIVETEPEVRRVADNKYEWNGRTIAKEASRSFDSVIREAASTLSPSGQ